MRPGAHGGAHTGLGFINDHRDLPRQHARTQRFTLGAPRAFTVAPDGERVVFLRSSSGTDRANALWVLDVASGQERVVADPVALLGGAAENLSAEERARRERSREGGAGIVGYATDATAELAAFALSGRLFTAELRVGTARELRVPGPVLDPRPSPTVGTSRTSSGARCASSARRARTTGRWPLPKRTP